MDFAKSCTPDMVREWLKNKVKEKSQLEMIYLLLKSDVLQKSRDSRQLFKSHCLEFASVPARACLSARSEFRVPKTVSAALKKKLADDI